MISLGTRAYNLTDFDQHLGTCPSCNEAGIFVSRYVNYFQFNNIPITTRAKFGHANCRKCKTQFKPGNSGQVDIMINEALDKMEVPKYLMAGAILYPLAIISAFAFFASF